MYLGFPSGSDGKDSACNAGDPRSIPGLGRSSGEGRGYPFLYSLMDRGAWWTTVHGVAESDITEWLTVNTYGLLKITNLLAKEMGELQG